jgi:HSP20 family protein
LTAQAACVCVGIDLGVETEENQIMATSVSEKQKGKEPAPATASSRELARDPWQAFGFPSLKRMRQEIDDLWGKFFSEVPALWAAERGDARWAFDVEDQADAYLIKAEAPGFEPTDFQIELRGNQLVLQARRSEEQKEQDQESFTATEFYHALTIPQYVDTDHISASYQQGILKVTLPKTEEGKGRRIPVQG